MKMTSNKPYLIRAIYDWIVDNQLTPYILVKADYPRVQVPQEFVHDGRIVLNISPNACRGLHLDNDKIVFTARFSGQSMQLSIPPAAVIAIYVKENGRGMEFGEEPYDYVAPADEPQQPERQVKKPALKLVKKEDTKS